MTSTHLTINPEALKSRSELVADAIRASILRGAFRPGDRLDQKAMAEDLKVSRIPVREALRILDTEGLITIIPNRGAVVTERSCRELEELYIIRQVLEGTATERAAETITDETLKQLTAIMDKADGVDNFEELLILNNDFHMVMYKSRSQPHLVKYIQQLRNMVAPYNLLYLDISGNREAAWEDHRAIYDACACHNGALANKLTQKHLDRVFTSILTELTKLKRCED